jgi:tetratricopeptide (TPR) repeat protein
MTNPESQDGKSSSSQEISEDATPATSGDATAASGTAPASRHGRGRLLLILGTLAAVVLLAWQPVSTMLHSRRVEQLRQKSKACQALEEWEQLANISTEWLSLEPGNVDAILKLALSQEKTGNIEAAAATLATVPDDDDRVLDALALQIDMYLSQLNRPSLAEAACLRLIRINSLAGRGYQRLIYYYSMTLQRAKLSKIIDDAIAAGCEPPEAYTYRLLLTALSFTDGQQTCARWLTGEPDNEAVLVAHAWHQARGSSSAAISESAPDVEKDGRSKAMNELLKTHPGNLEVLAFHVEEFLHEGDWSSAAKILGQARQDAENDSRFWRYKATILESQKQYENATAAARKAVELNAVDWRCHHQLAALLRLTTEPDQAGRESEIALAGKELEREMLQLPSARAWTPELPVRALEYLKICGELNLEKSLENRFD